MVYNGNPYGQMDDLGGSFPPYFWKHPTIAYQISQIIHFYRKFVIGNTWMFPKIVGFPPKSSILIEFSIINHPFWRFSPYFWKPSIVARTILPGPSTSWTWLSGPMPFCSSPMRLGKMAREPCMLVGIDLSLTYLSL